MRDEGVSHADRLSAELAAVGICGRLRARIVAEARDHLAEGDEERFGDPAELAREFADGLAADRSRRAAFGAFGALALAGVGFAAGWVAVLMGSQDIAGGRWVPLGVVAAVGIIVFPQIAFVAGGLALLRAVRRRRAAPEVALLLTRTRVGIAFGALSLASMAAYAIEFRLASWVPATTCALMIPLAASGVLVHRAAVVKSSVPGDTGDVFDDLPLRLPRRPALLLAATAGAAALATFAAAPNHEGIRNGIVEVVFVVTGWLALGRRLGLRR